MKQKIAIIGGGNLGTAIAEGLIASKFAKSQDVIITKRNPSTLKSFEKKGVVVTADNNLAVKQAGIVILAVKPYQVKEVIEGIQKNLSSEHILVSVVTGILINDIESFLHKKKLAIFRAMPNTAIAIRESMTCLSHAHSTNEQIEYIHKLFATLGEVVTIDEKLMDAATVLGACGTAFAMRYIRANIQGGIEIGFDAATASLIAAQTVKGAADLLITKNSHPESEIDKVTTPKGCTIAGLNEMEHRGFSSSIMKGVVASYDKIIKS